MTTTPTTPAAAIRVEILIDDDTLGDTPRRILGTDYRLNDTVVFINPNLATEPLVLVFGHEPVELTTFERGMQEVQTILNSPIVQSELAIRAARAKLSPETSALLDNILACLAPLGTDDSALVVDFLREIARTRQSTDEDERLDMACLLSRNGMENAARMVARGPAKAKRTQ